MTLFLELLKFKLNIAVLYLKKKCLHSNAQHSKCDINSESHYGFADLVYGSMTVVKSIGVAPITQLRTCIIKIVTLKGGHLMW